MAQLKKILAPTDLSKLSLPAVRYALEIGFERNAEVVVYHVVREDGDWFARDHRLNPASALLPRHEELLHRFIQDNFADMTSKVGITEVVEPGVPENRIVGKAKEAGADLIVMSTHGSTGIEQFIVGQ